MYVRCAALILRTNNMTSFILHFSLMGNTTFSSNLENIVLEDIRCILSLKCVSIFSQW